MNVKVTNGYETKEFDTMEDGLAFIQKYLNNYSHLSPIKIFDKCDGKMQVVVYQYSTLYLETFIIHREYDLRYTK